jgi:hypothetical protein
MRLSDLHHVSAESRGIKRQGILNKVRDIEGKRRYWELIKEHNPIHGTSRYYKVLNI